MRESPQTMPFLPHQPLRPLCRGLRQGWGFSLVELIAVISIVAVLCTLATTAFADLMRNYRINRTLDRITKTLDLAREDAIAKQTYVWIGFAESIGTTPMIIAPLTLVAGDFTNMSRARMVPIARPSEFPPDQLKSLTVTSGGTVTGSNAANIRFKPDATSTNITTTASFAFTPQGQVVSGDSIHSGTPCVDEVNLKLEFPTGERVDLRIDGQSGAMTSHYPPLATPSLP